MIYRKSECCITPEEIAQQSVKTDGILNNDKCDKCRENHVYQDESHCETDLMRRLSELQFAAIDLNLFLDTHPCDEEALMMFKKVNKTLESLKYDYVKKYGPLTAGDSSEKSPFEWVSSNYKWPWEK